MKPPNPIAAFACRCGGSVIAAAIAAAIGSKISYGGGSLAGVEITDARFFAAGIGAFLGAFMLSFDPRAFDSFPDAGCLFVIVALVSLGSLCWLFFQVS